MVGTKVLQTMIAPVASSNAAHCAAKERGAKSVVMTDSRLAPLARGADALLIVREGSAFAFRSLTGALCLAQALFVALAYRLELEIEETTHRGDYDD